MALLLMQLLLLVVVTSGQSYGFGRMVVSECFVVLRLERYQPGPALGQVRVRIVAQQYPMDFLILQRHLCRFTGQIPLDLSVILVLLHLVPILILFLHLLLLLLPVTVVRELKQQLLVQTLARLGQHERHEHLQHLWLQIHRRCVGEGVEDVPEHTGRPQKIVDRRIESLPQGTVLLGADLRVDGTQVKQDAGLLERHGTLARWYTRQ
uniref:Secreted peptide n=1 Tax=Anopheles braziliensis TaxID=58242 RepID=A0A2M3ZLJ5_9DIPT